MSITDVTSIIGAIVGVATLIGVFMALHQININKKQLSLSTISYCLEKFGKLDLRHDTNESIVKDYVDLVSEELFFFQYKYLPTEIAYEWLDGMLDYVPLLDKEDNVLNGDVCLLQLATRHKELLRNYPRVRHTFTVGHSIDISNIYEERKEQLLIRQQARRNLIASMYINLTENYTSFDE